MIRTKVAVSTAMICTLLMSCGSHKDESVPDARPRATVVTATATVGSIDEVVRSTGSFETLRDERIKSTIAGKVRRVFVLEGDAVEKGQVLVTILSQESNAAIAGAEQLVAQAGTDSARANAERALQVAQTAAAVARIAAPFSGAIVRRYVSEGEIVGQGADLVELVDPHSRYFMANIPLTDVSSIRIGQQALVTLPSLTPSPLSGRVQAITASTDPLSQSVQARISLTRIPSLATPGTFSDVLIRVGRHNNAVLIPRSAVFHDDELDRYQVWRIQGDSLALVTPVTVGLSDSNYVEIVSGLKPGDKIATTGGYGLPDSTAVTVAAH